MWFEFLFENCFRIFSLFQASGDAFEYEKAFQTDENVSCRVVGIEKFDIKLRNRWMKERCGQNSTTSELPAINHFFSPPKPFSISHLVDSVLFTERAEFYWFFYFSHVTRRRPARRQTKHFSYRMEKFMCHGIQLI